MIEQSNNKIVVIGTVYPGAELFLNDYFDSLEKQTFKEFDLLIANDNLDGLMQLLSGRNLDYLIIDVDSSASSNRRELIRKAMDLGYQKIIFTDCDDISKENRIDIVSNLLNTYHIVLNDLDIINLNGNEGEMMIFSERYGETGKILLPDLLTGNMMGLSNTAVKTEILQGCPALISGDPIAFDWYLWSSVLLAGHEAKFTAETSTQYRVYGDNVAGLPQSLNEKTVARGVEVKRQHYGLMAKLDSRYSKLETEFQFVSECLQNKSWRKDYLSALKKYAVENHIWWENIRTSSEVGLK